jgi:hypothetical protein
MLRHRNQSSHWRRSGLPAATCLAAMGTRHVIRDRSVAAPVGGASVAGDPLFLVEGFDGLVGSADIDEFPDQAIWGIYDVWIDGRLMASVRSRERSLLKRKRQATRPETAGRSILLDELLQAVHGGASFSDAAQSTSGALGGRISGSHQHCRHAGLSPNGEAHSPRRASHKVSE